eukprot:g7444.t1
MARRSGVALLVALCGLMCLQWAFLGPSSQVKVSQPEAAGALAAGAILATPESAFVGPSKTEVSQDAAKLAVAGAVLATPEAAHARLPEDRLEPLSRVNCKGNRWKTASFG